MKSHQILCIALAFAGVAAAQNPTVLANGIVNVASFAIAGQPNGAIARGSMVVIFGTNMGPAGLAQAASYPLPTSLSGTSIKITSGGVITDAIINYTSASQIAAIIPSATPAGAATMVVTFNGKSTAPAAFKVVNNSFGIFASNLGGSGPGIIATGDGKLFGLTTAANPGDVAVIWGTGLGPVAGNEAAGALPGDMNVPAEVIVGGVSANVQYRGRSGCCAGIDQISFNVPAVFGCRVPVALKINDVVSNYTSMAIAPAGHTCSDPGAPSAADLERFSLNGANVARIALNRVSTTTFLSPIIPSAGITVNRSDAATATFFKYSAAQLNTARSPFNSVPVGTCSVLAISGLSAFIQTWPDSFSADPVAPLSLDAGASISVVASGGTKPLLKGRDSVHPIGSPAYYSGYLATPAQTPGYLEPGVVTVSGPGGKDVGAFQTTIDVPAALKWTNSDAVTKVNRAAGQLVTWSGADPAATVIISGTSIANTGSITNLAGATFTCAANPADGQFAIPASVLLSLPVNSSNANVLSFQYGRMFVGTTSPSRALTASGVDFATSVATLDVEKLVDFQ